jgi:hypothetical protein
MLAFDHGSYVANCGDHTQIHVGPSGYLSQRLASMTQCISTMASKSCACKFVHLPYQLNLWLHVGFRPWSWFNPSPTFPSLEMIINLDLMLLLNMIESHVNLLSSTPLGGRKSCVGITQKSPAQSPSAMELCSLVRRFDLRIASLLILSLMTTFACYSFLV